MFYLCDIGIINSGRFDSWNTARPAGTGMSYWHRDDFEYYYTLLDNFLVADQYA